MRYPSIGKQATRAVCIDRPDGGLNLRDGFTKCADNQLTAALNVWYKSGELRSRPAFKEQALAIKNIGVISKRLIDGELYSGITDIYYNKNGTDYRLFWYSIYDESLNSTRFGFRFVSEKDVFNLPEISVDGKYMKCFVVQHKDYIYTFIEGLEIRKYTESDSCWKRLEEKDYYAPLVMTHCKTYGGIVTDDNGAQYSGTLAEGYNLLGSYYRMVYSTVNPQILDTENTESEHNMIYPLAQPVDALYNRTVTARLTTAEGCFTHSISFKGRSGDNTGGIPVIEKADTDPGDGLLMNVESDGSIIFYNSVTQKVATVKAADYREDNLEITAPCSNEDSGKVIKMTRAIWFGGASGGLSGGTRLFLGGNTDKDEQSLVLWSDLNNPLYFPENCYAYVGNANTPVTAFGKQNNSLVIFKSNEIFSTQYNQGNTVSASDLTEQITVDLTVAAAYFPMTQLNSVIGCDCPESIQLCRNRLVWATTAGKVYTLVSQSGYSERNIYEVSEMIEASLKMEPELKAGSVLSVDFGGIYMLFCGCRVYIMDYNSYGYIYAASHAKNEDANLRIPWFYWELPYNETDILISPILSVMAVGNALRVNYVSEISENNSYGVKVYYLKTAMLDETEKYDICIYPGEHYDWNDEHRLPIKTSVKTKLFDFGIPYAEKQIPLVQLELGDNDGKEITVSYITDSPCRGQDDVINPTFYGAGRNDGAYAGMIVLRPPVRFCRSIGIELKCEGAMAIRSITVYYRITGGVK